MQNRQKLFTDILSDYALIANDGREVRVNKFILCMESDMFTTLFSNIMMKQENSFTVNCSYDILYNIVRWMYDYEIEIQDEMYDVADQLMINGLLDWKLYIIIDDRYIDRFIQLINDDIEKTIIEERHYKDIYDAVVKFIAERYYVIDPQDTRIDSVKRIQKYSIDNLYKLPFELIIEWYKSKFRINYNDDMIMFAVYYTDYEDIDNIKDELVPLIKYNNIDWDTIRRAFKRNGTGMYTEALNELYWDHFGKKPKYSLSTYRELVVYGKIDGEQLFQHIMFVKPTYDDIKDKQIVFNKYDHFIFSTIVKSTEEFNMLKRFCTNVLYKYTL